LGAASGINNIISLGMGYKRIKESRDKTKKIGLSKEKKMKEKDLKNKNKIGSFTQKKIIFSL